MRLEVTIDRRRNADPQLCGFALERGRFCRPRALSEMPRLTMRSWRREPLLHFLVIGLLIFAVDHLVSPDSNEDRVISVDEAVENKLISLFEEGKGRAPSDQDLERLIRRWVQNEVMYREALALGLDQGDEMIRERIILKMRLLVFNNIVVDPPSEEDLHQWFDSNRSRYDFPQRFDLVQFRVADATADGRKLAEDLASTMVEGTVPQRYVDSLRRYENRTHENISGMFGNAFATGLLEQPDNRWHALPSDKGWHVARVEAVHAAVPASFESKRSRIEAEWRKEQQRRQVFEALKEIRERYDIRREART